MIRRKILVTIVLSVVLMAALASTALATYWGWWNNSLAFGSVFTTYKGNYFLESDRGGFLGHFNSDHQGGTYMARMYRHDDHYGEWIPYSLHNYIDANAWADEQWDITENRTYKYGFKSNWCSGATQTVVSNDAGYFYVD